MSKKFLTEQLSQHVKLLQLKKWFGSPPPPFSHITSKQKTPHTPPHSLICLGGALLGGGSAWTERALPEDYRMGGGGHVWLWACLYLCWRCVHLCGMSVGDPGWWFWGGVGFVCWKGGVSNFFSLQNAAIVSKIEQCRALTLIFQSIHYLLCSYLCLNEKKKPRQC